MHKKGLHAKALHDFNEAIKMDPKLANAFLGRGWTHESLKQYDDAIKDFEEAIHFDAKMHNAYHGKGGALYDKGMYPQALEAFNKVIELAPKFANAYSWRALVHDKLGHPAEAAADRRREAELKEEERKAKRP